MATTPEKINHSSTLCLPGNLTSVNIAQRALWCALAAEADAVLVDVQQMRQESSTLVQRARHVTLRGELQLACSNASCREDVQLT